MELPELEQEYYNTVDRIDARITAIQQQINHLRGQDYFNALRRLRYLNEERDECLLTAREIHSAIDAPQHAELHPWVRAK